MYDAISTFLTVLHTLKWRLGSWCSTHQVLKVHTIFPAWLACSTIDVRVWAAHINWLPFRISIAKAIPRRGAICILSWHLRSTVADNTVCNRGALHDNSSMMFCQLNVFKWAGLVSRRTECFSGRLLHKFWHSFFTIRFTSSTIALLSFGSDRAFLAKVFADPMTSAVTTGLYFDATLLTELLFPPTTLICT